MEQTFPDEDFAYWYQYVEENWAQSLSRILIRIQNYQHGGAFLITNNIDTDLDIKYKIAYDRLHNSICNLAKFSIANWIYSSEIHNDYMEEHSSVPMRLYLEESVSDFTKEETIDELKGAIRFVASLSCIDGLVVLNPELKVKGFGTVIKNIELPKYVYVSKFSKISVRKLQKIDPNHFGTRHRSMFSYCWKHEGSLGFVVSQDGDIRAIMKANNKLVMWENLRVQQMIKSTKLKRKANAKKRDTK